MSASCDLFSRGGLGAGGSGLGGVLGRGDDLGLLNLKVAALGEKLLVIGQNATLGLASVELAGERSDEIGAGETVLVLGEHVDDRAGLRGELVLGRDGLEEVELVHGGDLGRLGNLHSLDGLGRLRSVGGLGDFLGGFFGHGSGLSCWFWLCQMTLAL